MGKKSKVIFTLIFNILCYISQEMVTEMYSGPCVALEILQTNPAKTFRELCGPADPVSYR